jgi:hypothetical protein
VLGLHSGGVNATTAIAAVALYRVISLGFVVGTGWITWLRTRPPGLNEPTDGVFDDPPVSGHAGGGAGRAGPVGGHGQDQPEQFARIPVRVDESGLLGSSHHLGAFRGAVRGLVGGERAFALLVQPDPRQQPHVRGMREEVLRQTTGVGDQVTVRDAHRSVDPPDTDADDLVEEALLVTEVRVQPLLADARLLRDAVDPSTRHPVQRQLGLSRPQDVCPRLLP